MAPHWTIHDDPTANAQRLHNEKSHRGALRCALWEHPPLRAGVAFDRVLCLNDAGASSICSRKENK